MPTLHVGDEISVHPTVDALAAGLPLMLPKRNCKVLELDSSTFFQFPPKAGDRTALLAYLDGTVGAINIPEPFRTTNFGKEGYPLTLDLNRTLCPWGNHNTVRVTADITYNEGTNPTNGVDAPPAHYDYDWANDAAPLDKTELSGTPSGPFGYLGGNTPWEVHFVLEAIPTIAGGCDVFLRCTATPAVNYDFLSGTPATQVKETGCDNFHLGLGTLVFSWIGVHFNPGDPIGLVRSMQLIVRGSNIFT